MKKYADLEHILEFERTKSTTCSLLLGMSSRYMSKPVLMSPAGIKLRTFVPFGSQMRILRRCALLNSIAAVSNKSFDRQVHFSH